MNAKPADQDGVRATVSAAEWQVRMNLAAAYRLVALYGWDDLVFTHISARLPGPEHHFLINPYGMMFDEITASLLVKVDLDGRKVSDSPYEVNPAGFTIHSAVHAAREDALSPSSRTNADHLPITNPFSPIPLRLHFAMRCVS